jgi:hypothetical protein
MNMRSWSGAQLVLAVLLYWAVLAVGIALYARRPGRAARQAAARVAAPATVEPGMRPGEHRVTFAGEVHYTRPLVLALVPPALLVLAWLLA